MADSMSPFLLRIKKGSAAYFTHDSEEFIYIAQGKIDFLYEGKTYHLQSGDSFYFNSRIKHGLRNQQDTKAVLVTVNFNYQRF